MNNLAALCHATGRYDEAERLYLRSLAVKEKLLGGEHLDVAMTLNNLAVLYKSPQKFEDAKRLYRRALAIFESRLGTRLTRNSRPVVKTTNVCNWK